MKLGEGKLKKKVLHNYGEIEGDDEGMTNDHCNSNNNIYSTPRSKKLQQNLYHAKTQRSQSVFYQP